MLDLRRRIGLSLRGLGQGFDGEGQCCWWIRCTSTQYVRWAVLESSKYRKVVLTIPGGNQELKVRRARM